MLQGTRHHQRKLLEVPVVDTLHVVHQAGPFWRILHLHPHVGILRQQQGGRPQRSLGVDTKAAGASSQRRRDLPVEGVQNCILYVGQHVNQVGVRQLHECLEMQGIREG